MIVSNLKGRLRLKDPLLRVKDIRRKVEELLNSLGGIRQYELNSRVGSLLIIYDPAIQKVDSLLKALRRVLPWIEREGSPKPSELKYLNIAMLFSLTLSILGALGGLWTFHLYFGLLFLASLGLHLYRYRKILLWG